MSSTICALATPPGAGGIAVVRVSGPEAYAVVEEIFIPRNPAKRVAEAKGYTAMLGHYHLRGEEMDETIALFFRVDTVVITGEKRYTEAEIRQASGVEDGDNLFLLNKYQVIRNIAEALPYIEIENTRIQRKLPDTLLIQVQECGDPLAWTQDGTVWLMSPAGKIVEQTDTAAGYPTVDGCELLAPSVGTQIAVDTAYETRRESLLELLAVLDETGELAKVDAIHLGEASYISMDYMDRFTVKMPYQADFSYKLRVLELAINSDKIQDNMTGTFDMRQEDGQVIFDQDTRK